MRDTTLEYFFVFGDHNVRSISFDLKFQLVNNECSFSKIESFTYKNDIEFHPFVSLDQFSAE